MWEEWGVNSIRTKSCWRACRLRKARTTQPEHISQALQGKASVVLLNADPSWTVVLVVPGVIFRRNTHHLQESIDEILIEESWVLSIGPGLLSIPGQRHVAIGIVGVGVAICQRSIVSLRTVLKSSNDWTISIGGEVVIDGQVSI